MNDQGIMVKTVSLAVFITILVPTWAEVVIDDSKTGIEHMTILPGGVKLCSQSGSTREKILSLNETAYIFINYTMSLSFESSCFSMKHFIKFSSDKWYNKVNRKSILQITFTTDGLVIEVNDIIEYSQNDFKKINSEITNAVDCLKRSNILNLNVLEENKYNWFMDRKKIEENSYSLFMDNCDLLVFERKNQDLCPIYHGVTDIDKSMVLYQSNKKNSSLDILFFDTIVIKPISTTVRIITKYCNDKNLITEFIPSDFLNHDEDSENWFKFDYDVIKSVSNLSLTISIAGIPIDHMNYENACDEEPKFSFDGVNNIKTVCNPYDQVNNFDIDNYFKNYSYDHETQNSYNPDIPYDNSDFSYDYKKQNIYKSDNPYDNSDIVEDFKPPNLYNSDIPYVANTPETRYNYNTSETRYAINFPYIIILMMILVGKAICGYAIYKRRQARLIIFTSRRLVEHYGNVSPLGRGTIIVAANGTDYPRQSTIQSNPPRQPSEDLPPAYNNLQQLTDIDPPGYEDACKRQTTTPPEYANSCRDNIGFKIEEETNSVNHTTESLEINQLSTNNVSAVSSNLS